MRSTLEKSCPKRSEKIKSLVLVKPGTYMMLHKNEMKRVHSEVQGLLVGTRIDGDNHRVVLLEEDLILMPT